MKFLISISFIFICFNAHCQLKCSDIVERIDPSPQKLLNDSLPNLVSLDQMEVLKSEQNLIFTFIVEYGKVTQVRMNYFFEDEFAEDEQPLDPKLIKILETFFAKNINLIFKKAFAVHRNTAVECTFIAHVEYKNQEKDKNP